MSYSFDSRFGDQLYALLPEIYRSRDKENNSGSTYIEHSMARYLDAHGVLLDSIHATLEQQLKDVSPETCQDWLLPYFAQLVEARLVSPDKEGRHLEVSNAISWRQRKGTLQCAEEIAESVGQMEVELQEGWQRVAITPRIGMPLLPIEAVDSSLDLDETLAYEASQHPSLPVATVDLRKPSRAIISEGNNPANKISFFAGVRQTWRQASQHGVPCFPGSYDDVSPRVVDIRSPDIDKGCFHPKRLLMFTPPATGFFVHDPDPVNWEDRHNPASGHLIEELVESGVTVIRNLTDRVVTIQGDVLLDAKPYRIEGLRFNNALEIAEGGSLVLSAVEAGTVRVNNAALDEPVLTAADCLFAELSVTGLVMLDSCTVFEKAYLTAVQAIDCIFMEIIGNEITGSIEYSRVPADAPLATDRNKMVIKSHISDPNDSDQYLLTTDDPEFISGQTSLRAQVVLSPRSPKSIFAGSSDQSEMGYFHHGRQKYAVNIDGTVHFSTPGDGGYPMVDLIFSDVVTVSDGPVMFLRSVAPDLNIDTPLNDSGEVIPSLIAVDCLFTNISVANGLARLEYCTVMDAINCKHLQASDCLFVSGISGVRKKPVDSLVDAFLNCVRYSAIPEYLFNDIAVKPANDPVKRMLTALRLINRDDETVLGTNTLTRPVFRKLLYCDSGSGSAEVMEAVYGNRGYGVLSPLTPGSVRFGAEDGGEMGAYHHRHYALKTEAMQTKIREFLPVGIESVLIEDERLLHLPPQILEA